MNTKEHLLTILAEECLEVGQRATKALRFGLAEVQPDQALSNAERIIEEYDDLLGVMEMLHDRGLLPASRPERIAAKKEKVTRFLAYSATCGTLSDAPPAPLST